MNKRTTKSGKVGITDNQKTDRKIKDRNSINVASKTSSRTKTNNKANIKTNNPISNKYNNKNNNKVSKKTHNTAKKKHSITSSPIKNSDEFFYLYGIHSVISALQNKQRNIIKLLVTEEQLKKLNGTYNLQKLLNNRKINYKVASIGEIKTTLVKYHSTSDINSQSIIALVQKLPEINLDKWLANHKAKERSIILVLDEVQDPHNLGATMRSALGFNVDAIILSNANSVRETATVSKISVGAVEHVPIIRVKKISSALQTLKEHFYHTVGLENDTKTKNIKHIVEYDKVVLVIGSEHKGIKSVNKKYCDTILHIPCNPKLESLNLSNAVAISLYCWQE